MLAIYLSGTGNTRHCVTKIATGLNPEAVILPFETEHLEDIIMNHDDVILGYPTQFSNAPYMVRDFIKQNNTIWKGRHIFLVVTMGAFAGDVSGCCARLLRKYGATIDGAIQVKMPDSVLDVKALKKSFEKNVEIIKKADTKMDDTIHMIKDHHFPREGLSFGAHLVGLFGQRLWFYHKTFGYSKKLKIDSSKCIGCGTCVKGCPMHNLEIKDNHAYSHQRCTMCYRCIAVCPKQAITLLGKKVLEQNTLEDYLKTDSEK